MNFLKGKKTYIVGLVFLVLAVLAATGNVPPEWVFAVLASVGAGALRAALQELCANKGWKTYASAAITAVVAVLQAAGVTLPIGLSYELIYSLCAALGIVGLRAAVGKLKPLM